MCCDVWGIANSQIVHQCTGVAEWMSANVLQMAWVHWDVPVLLFRNFHLCIHVHMRILLANNVGLSSATWKTNPEFRNTFSGYNSTKQLVGYWEIFEKHLHFCSGPVNSLRARFASVICSHTCESPHWQQATIWRVLVQWIKSWKITWKNTICAILVCMCALLATDDDVQWNGSPNENWFASA